MTKFLMQIFVCLSIGLLSHIAQANSRRPTGIWCDKSVEEGLVYVQSFQLFSYRTDEYGTWYHHNSHWIYPEDTYKYDSGLWLHRLSETAYRFRLFGEDHHSRFTEISIEQQSDGLWSADFFGNKFKDCRAQFSDR